MNRSTDRRATFVIFCLVVLLSVFGRLGAAVRRSKPLVVKCPSVVGSKKFDQIATSVECKDEIDAIRSRKPSSVKVGGFEANGA